MAHTCLLLELATELRLEIYAYVVVDSLASGCSKGLAGLSLSCRTVNRELASDFFAHVRPLLDAQIQWRKTCAEHPAVRNVPLCLRLQCSAGNLFSHTGAEKLVIPLPMPSHWIMWFVCKTNRYQIPKLEDLPSFVQLVSNLRPLLHLQWAEVTIKLCETATASPSGFEDFDNSFGADTSHEKYPYYLARVQEAKTDGVALDIGFAHRVSFALWQALVDVGNNDEYYFDRTDRLVVNYNNAVKLLESDLLINTLKTLYCGFIQYVHHHVRPHLLPKPKRAWITRVMDGADDQRGWKTVYDFCDDLAYVEGALWEVYLGDGCWRVKRLFKEIDGYTRENLLDFERAFKSRDHRKEEV
jgi:hypothetical protein